MSLIRVFFFDKKDEYFIRQEHLPQQDETVIIYNDEQDNIAEITYKDKTLNFRFLTDSQINILAEVLSASVISIDAVANVCIDADYQCEKLFFTAKSLISYQEIEVDKLVCEIKETLTFSEKMICVKNYASIKARIFQQNVPFESKGVVFVDSELHNQNGPFLIDRLTVEAKHIKTTDKFLVREAVMMNIGCWEVQNSSLTLAEVWAVDSSEINIKKCIIHQNATLSFNGGTSTLGMIINSGGLVLQDTECNVKVGYYELKSNLLTENECYVQSLLVKNSKLLITGPCMAIGGIHVFEKSTLHAVDLALDHQTECHQSTIVTEGYFRTLKRSVVRDNKSYIERSVLRGKDNKLEIGGTTDFTGNVWLDNTTFLPKGDVNIYHNFHFGPGPQAIVAPRDEISINIYTGGSCELLAPINPKATVRNYKHLINYDQTIHADSFESYYGSYSEFLAGVVSAQHQIKLGGSVYVHEIHQGKEKYFPRLFAGEKITTESTNKIAPYTCPERFVVRIDEQGESLCREQASALLHAKEVDLNGSIAIPSLYSGGYKFNNRGSIETGELDLRFNHGGTNQGWINSGRVNIVMPWWQNEGIVFTPSYTPHTLLEKPGIIITPAGRNTKNLVNLGATSVRLPLVPNGSDILTPRNLLSVVNYLYPSKLGTVMSTVQSSYTLLYSVKSIASSLKNHLRHDTAKSGSAYLRAIWDKTENHQWISALYQVKQAVRGLSDYQRQNVLPAIHYFDNKFEQNNTVSPSLTWKDRFSLRYARALVKSVGEEKLSSYLPQKWSLPADKQALLWPVLNIVTPADQNFSLLSIEGNNITPRYSSESILRLDTGFIHWSIFADEKAFAKYSFDVAHTGFYHVDATYFYQSGDLSATHRADINAKVWQHRGHLSGNQFSIQAKEATLEGSAQVKMLSAEVENLPADAAKQLAQGTGAIGSLYKISQAVHVGSNNFDIALSQKFFDESRDIDISLRGSSVALETGFSVNYKVAFEAEQDVVLNHPTTTASLTVASGQTITNTAVQKAQQNIAMSSKGEYHSTKNGLLESGNQVFLKSKSNRFDSGQQIQAKKILLETEKGTILYGQINATEHLALATKDPQAEFIIRGEAELIMNKPLFFNPEGSHPVKGGVKPGNVYLFPDKHNKLRYLAIGTNGQRYEGFMDELSHNPLTKEIYKKAAENPEKYWDRPEANAVKGDIRAEIIKRHGIEQGLLQGGDGKNHNGVGILVDGGRFRFEGTAAMRAEGHIVGQMQKLSTTPFQTDSLTVRYQGNKTVTLKGQHPQLSEIVSTNGYIALNVKEKAELNSVRLRAKEGTNLHAESIVTTSMTSTSKKKSENNKGKKKSHTHQTVSPVDLENNAFSSLDADNVIDLRGIHIYGSGRLQLTARNQIITGAPIVKEKIVTRKIDIRVLVNGIDIGNLFNALSSSAKALLNNDKLPRTLWLKQWQELCAREELVGIIDNCVHGDKIYDQLREGWNAGVSGTKLLNSITKGINNKTLIKELAKRWGISEAEIQIKTTHTKYVHIEDRFASNVAIQQFNIEINVPTMVMNGGGNLRANHIKLRTDHVIFTEGKLRSSDKMTRKSLSIGINKQGVDIGVGYDQDKTKACHYINPSIVADEQLLFDHVLSVTGNGQILAGSMEGDIQSISLVTKPDQQNTSRIKAAVNTTGTHAAAYYGTGKAQQFTPENTGTIQAKNAQGLHIGHIDLTGGKAILPGAHIDKATGRPVVAKTNYKGFGISANPRELYDVATENRDAQVKDKNLFTTVGIQPDFVKRQEIQKPVVYGATIKEVGKGIHTKDSDGKKITQDLDFRGNFNIPITNAARLQQGRADFMAASKKASSALKRTGREVTRLFSGNHAVEKPFEIKPEHVLAAGTPSLSQAEMSPSVTEELNSTVLEALQTDKNSEDVLVIEALASPQDEVCLNVADELDSMTPGELPQNSVQAEIDNTTTKKSVDGFFKKHSEVVETMVSRDIPIFVVLDRIFKVAAPVLRKTPAFVTVVAYGAVVFGTHEAIISTMEAYKDYKHNHPNSKFSLGEFLKMYAKDIGKNAAISAVTGIATGVVGKNIAPLTRIPMTRGGRLAAQAGKFGAEVATATNVSSELHGETLTFENYLKNLAYGGIFTAWVRGVSNVPSSAQYLRPTIEVPKAIRLSDLIKNIPESELVYTLQGCLPSDTLVQDIVGLAKLYKQIPELADQSIDRNQFFANLSEVTKKSIPTETLVPGVEEGIAFYATADDFSLAQSTLREVTKRANDPVSVPVLETLQSETLEGRTQLFFQTLPDTTTGGQYHSKDNQIKINTHSVTAGKTLTNLFHEAGHLFAEKRCSGAQNLFLTAEQEQRMYQSYSEDCHGLKPLDEAMRATPIEHMTSEQKQFLEHLFEMNAYPDADKPGETIMRLIQSNVDPSLNYLQKYYPTTWEYVQDIMETFSSEERHVSDMMNDPVMNWRDRFFKSRSAPQPMEGSVEGKNHRLSR